MRATGRTLLQEAAFEGYLEMVELLAELGAKLDGKEESNGLTALHYAAYFGYENTSKLLLEQGVSPNVVADNGDTPLLLASGAFSAAINKAPRPNVKIVKLLLAKGANPNIAGFRGRLPLHNAIFNGYMDTVEALVAAKAELNVRAPQSGKYPLHYAAYFGNLKTAQLLLKNRADPNVCSVDGDTPLFFAAGLAMDTTNKPAKPLLEMVKLLLQYGADPISKRKNGETPLQVALHKKRWEMVEALSASSFAS